MKFEQESAQAIANLIGAIMPVIDPQARRTVLTIFESLNSQNLSPGPFRDQLDQAVNIQRAILQHLPG